MEYNVTGGSVKEIDGCKFMQTMILIPVLEPDIGIVGYVEQLSRRCQGTILVADCGSGTAYHGIFQELAAISHCAVLTGERSKGAALKAGLTYFMKLEDLNTYKGVVLADFEGKYRVDDVISVAARIGDKHRIVLGARNFPACPVSPKTASGNDLTKKLLKLFYHIQVTDTQTGLMGFPKSIVPMLLGAKGDKLGCGTEMLLICARDSVEICEVPIDAPSFHDSSEKSSASSQVQEFLRICSLFFGTFLKFVCSSLSASVIDISVFSVLIHTVFTTNTKSILVATFAARIVSSLYNFMINRKLVFSSSNNVKVEVAGFYGLAVAKMLCSAALVAGMTLILPKFPSVNKMAIDFLLFFVGYYIQKKYIFRGAGQR